MKHSLIGIGVVIIFALAMWFGWSKYEAFLTQGRRPTKGTQILNQMEEKGVPNFTLTDIKGKSFTLSDYKDKIVIVNFWASWCEPCVDEFPSLIKLIDHFKGDIILIAISADHTEEDLTTFLKAFEAQNNPHMIVAWDKDKKVAADFGTEILPESYILGFHNKLIRKIAGVDNWYAPGAISYFGDLISKRTHH